MEGIDNTSPESQDTVSAFPGKTFTGLQMLCLMDVAFRRAEPSLNTGLDFQKQYDTALTMFEARR